MRPGHLARGDHGVALLVVVVHGHADDAVVDLGLERRLGDGLDLAQQHAGDLHNRQRLLDAQVRDHDADRAVLHADDLVAHALDLGLHVGVGEAPPNVRLKVADGVLVPCCDAKLW